MFQKISRFFYRASTWKVPKGSHPSRYQLYETMKGFKDGEPMGKRVVTISDSQHLAEILGYNEKQIEDYSYPEHDFCNLPIEDNSVDSVISDQVLEHVEGGPHRAIEECFRILKPGGLTVHATVFNYQIHGCPNDYWRFTPQGLEVLIKKHGTAIAVGGWGNRWMRLLWAFGLRWEPMPHAKWHPCHWAVTKNDPLRPIVVWVVARKSG